MSATYLVFGAGSVEEGRAAVENYDREEREKFLDSTAAGIAKALAPLQAKIAGRADAVAKARRVDSERLDQIAADLAEIKTGAEDLAEVRRGIESIAADLKKVNAGLGKLAATGSTGPYNSTVRIAPGRPQ